MSRGSILLLVFVGALTATGVGTLAEDSSAGIAQPGGPEFYRLTGGLGFGPAVTADGCEFAFDPRLCPACSQDWGPIPGGAVFCPHHGLSILEYEPLPER